MKRTEIVAKTEELVTPIIEENHFELVDVEYVREGANWYLRIYADKEGGINIDDCVLISRALEEKLDAEDFISDAYILEVSSPGLGRPLKKEKDFKRSIGKAVECKLYKAIDKQKEFEGVLKDFKEEKHEMWRILEDTVTIEIDEKDLVLDRKDIAMIRLAIEF